MATPHQPVTLEAGVKMRERYAEGVPVSRIAAEFDVSLSTLYFWLDGGPSGGGPRLPPIPRRRVIYLGKRRRRSLMASRISLVARLWRTIEMQVRDIEDRVRRGLQTEEQREQDNRTIAVIAKVCRDLPLLDEGTGGASEREPGTDNEHDQGPRDLDEFRRDLARKVDAVVAGRAAGSDRGPDRG